MKTFLEKANGTMDTEVCFFTIFNYELFRDITMHCNFWLLGVMTNVYLAQKTS